MFGRSPDHVASFVTGMAMKPDALPAPCAHADNLMGYYRHIRDHDTYVVYAVVPPQAPVIRSSTTSRIFRCRRCGWCARTTMASSLPA
jgi:hypothetical protein